MRFGAMLRNLGRPSSWREAIASLRRQHGRGTSRYLADEFGVSQRTAQRWMADTQEPAPTRREAVRAKADPGEVVRHKLDTAQTIHVGKVRVRYGVRDEGVRNIGTLRVTPELRGQLDQAARQIEAGNNREAERILSAAILAEYGAQRAGDARDVTRAQLSISDWPDGMVTL